MTGVEKAEAITPVAAPHRGSGSIEQGTKIEKNDSFEVFKKEEGAVDFRTVEWIHASVIFLKGTHNWFPMGGARPFLLCPCSMVNFPCTDAVSLHIYSHLCDRRLGDPIRVIYPRSLSRRRQRRRLAVCQHLLRHCPRQLPKSPSEMPFHRRHGRGCRRRMAA